jgi:hypothetical protein
MSCFSRNLAAREATQNEKDTFGQTFTAAAIRSDSVARYGGKNQI